MVVRRFQILLVVALFLILNASTIAQSISESDKLKFFGDSIDGKKMVNGSPTKMANSGR